MPPSATKSPRYLFLKCWHGLHTHRLQLSGVTLPDIYAVVHSDCAHSDCAQWLWTRWYAHSIMCTLIVHRIICSQWLCTQWYTHIVMYTMMCALWFCTVIVHHTMTYSRDLCVPHKNYLACTDRNHSVVWKHKSTHASLQLRSSFLAKLYICQIFTLVPAKGTLTPDLWMLVKKLCLVAIWHLSCETIWHLSCKTIQKQFDTFPAKTNKRL